MTETLTLDDLYAALSLSGSAVALIWLTLAFASANLAYFDPRRADESARALPVLIVVGPALYDARRARKQLRDRARHAALGVAISVVLHLTAPKGNLR